MPALITLLPLAIGLFAWAEPGDRSKSAIWAVINTSGATYALAMISRNRGKNIQPSLWKSWGGSPTLQLLRHRGIGNPVLRERWHKSLEKLVDKKFPSVSEEFSDPAAADALYEAATRLLINQRRNKTDYHLVYKENVNYGFCRNLFAFRKIGIFISLGGTLVAVASGIHGTNSVVSMPWACSVINLLALLAWTFLLTADWVSHPGFAYAERLLESCDAPKKLSLLKRKNASDKNNVCIQ